MLSSCEKISKEAYRVLNQRGKYWYGDSQADIRGEVLRYSKRNGYSAQYFADAICSCGNREFQLSLDDNEDAAIRRCSKCGIQHAIGDSGDYLDDAKLEECGCPCGTDDLEITVGVSLYANSEDVRWLYLGCRRPQCGLTAVYGDWKCEFVGDDFLLQKV